MGDYCNVKPWDLNNTSDSIMRRKVYILESFYFKGAQIPNHELPETMGFNEQPLRVSVGKRLL